MRRGEDESKNKENRQWHATHTHTRPLSGHAKFIFEFVNYPVI